LSSLSYKFGLRDLLFSIIFFSSIHCVLAQGKGKFVKVDESIKAFSLNKIKSKDSLIAFVTSNFKDPDERVRAFYSWIALNITYDTQLLDHYRLSSGLGLQNLSSSRTQHPDTVFKYRLAVCEGICQLMNACCEKVGIRSKMIAGISKVENVVDDELLHTWTAVYTDTSWKLLDITWSGGHINLKGVYVKKFNDRFFYVEPQDFIKDHWPLDPMWQLLPVAVTKKEFMTGVQEPGTSQRSYHDSIKAYLRLTKDAQEYTDLVHYHRADPSNEVYTRAADYLIYNKAVTIFNKSSLYFEDYIAYAKDLEGKPITKKHTKKCIALLQEPRKLLSDGLALSRGRHFFHEDIQKKFDAMVAGSFQRYRDINKLIEEYNKILRSFN
jgi:hypothetical protein